MSEAGSVDSMEEAYGDGGDLFWRTVAMMEYVARTPLALQFLMANMWMCGGIGEAEQRAQRFVAMMYAGEIRPTSIMSEEDTQTSAALMRGVNRVGHLFKGFPTKDVLLCARDRRQRRRVDRIVLEENLFGQRADRYK
jgi:hypothetical protein